MWRDKNGDPTFKSGRGRNRRLVYLFRLSRYNSECFVCHGPDGAGSHLRASACELTQDDRLRRIFRDRTGGKQDLGAGQEMVMPAFAENKNVMCYLNDIYVYLRARSQDAIPRGRPDKHAPSRPAFADCGRQMHGA